MPTIITEYLPNGSLKKMLDDESAHEAPTNWNPTKKQICIIGVAAAMRYLHRRNLIHRDLKPENVLLDDNLYPKVCDFGFARSISQDIENEMTQDIGSPVYMAPEVLHGDDYTEKCDVYSFAIFAYQVSTGVQPYIDLFKINRDASFNDLIKWVYDKQERPKFDNCNINKNLQALIEACWTHNPNERLSFDAIYDRLVDDRTLVINNQVDLNEVQDYIRQIPDELTETGKAKLTIYDYRPKNPESLIPDIDEDRIKMFNNFIQNDFSGDIDVEFTLFIKILGYITTNKDPQNFAKVTFFANKLAQDGNKKAETFLKDAFGEVIGQGKKSLSKNDITGNIRKIRSLNISQNVEIILKDTFAGLNDLLYINLPPSIEKIGQAAFKKCKNLIWISINCKVTEIEKSSFEDCSNLKYVELSSSINIIKENAFKKCTSLEQIIIPKSVTIIEKNAFHGCKKLMYVYMSSSTNCASTFPVITRVINH